MVHAADLHLDSPLRGLVKLDEDAPRDRIRSATRFAFNRLVSLCVEQRASVLLLAGDLFDGDLRDHNTAVYFSRALGRLALIGCRVFIVRGNHDAASEVTRSVTLKEHVHVFDHRRPETLVLEDIGLAIHGQSFGTRAVTDNLARAFPAPERGHLNVGLLHTNATGSSVHDNYAPCTVTELRDKGYDYWALGHIHARQVLHEDPWIVYPGNLQGRHVRETGPKGATVIEVEGGRVTAVTHHDLDVVRWETVEVDAGEARSLDDVGDAVGKALSGVLEAAGMDVLVRVTVRGGGTTDDLFARNPERVRAEVSARAAEIPGLWTERILLEFSGTRLRAPGRLDGFRAALAAEFSALAKDDEHLRPYQEMLAGLTRSAARHLDRSPDGAAALRAHLAAAEEILVSRLDTEDPG
jgi:DNA repair exonuclease SbcCD nuclease subunit